jgi:CubicO group peptidase (beta-lactamase class C family)
VREWIIATLISFIFAPVTLGGENNQTGQRIQRMENSLVEFTSPADMVKPNPVSAENLKTLAERMAHYKIPGVGIAVLDQNNVDWVRGYGTTRAGSDNPITSETLFQAASTSKLVVSAITLRYVEKGLLDLDEDVTGKLKSWKIPENPFTEKQKVTLRLLLTHRAGLNRPEGGFSWEEGSRPTLIQTLNGEAPAENKPAAIVYEPGSKWEYSNFGYLVIQQLLENVVGKPFPEIAKETVFDPLGMTYSTFEVPLAAGRAKFEAVPHDAEGTAHEPDMHPTAVANGGLMTTPTDLAIFTNELILAYHGDSDKLLSKDMARRMCHEELDLDPAVLGVQLGEGLGVLLHGEGEAFSFLHPGDNMPGASSWLMGWPGTRKGIIVMTNGAMGNLLAMEIIAAFLNEYD